ncbi:unnamed protein product [Calicophoron daubneyi]|uniref:Leucine-rich repeat-containing protein 9 n=1 Tax=Calicophoron daubneyi TaxID=300641 RepID=A0AAV2TFE7_CALDB
MELSQRVILGEICSQNGVDLDDPEVNLLLIEKLEILFSGLSKCIKLDAFSSLTELMIISQQLSHISCMESCPNLKKLWFCECQIAKIENLKSCIHLEELYMYENLISSIENLDDLKELKVLWLNDNRISTIENLSNLHNLSDLNLSGNLITLIGKALDRNGKLTSLRLSGNNVSNVQELLYLTGLPNLSLISLNEPGYSKNPVCKNPNLPIILLYYFPSLLVLDDATVDSPELRQAVRTVMQMKQSFYMMKSQHAKSGIELKLSRLRDILTSVSSRIGNQIELLDKAMRSLQIKKASKRSTDSSSDSCEPSLLAQWIKDLKQRISFWEYMNEKFRNSYCNARSVLKHQESLRTRLYQMELEMCGYFEVDEGKPEDDWFQYCSDLLASRFCCHDLKAVNIIGIRIIKMYKISNKLLQANFSRRYEELFGDSEQTDEENCCERLGNLNNQDYLLVSRPDEANELETYMSIITSGQNLSLNGLFLTNSLNLADRKALDKVLQRQWNRAQWSADHFASFVLVRVMTADNSVQDICHTDWIKNRGDNESAGGSGKSHCSCLSDSRVYRVADPNVVLPEFVIQLQYITKIESVSPFYQMLFDRNAEHHHLSFEEDIKTDLSILRKIPSKILRQTAIEITDHSVDAYIEQRPGNRSEGTTLTLNDMRCPKSLNLLKFHGLTHLRLTHCHLQRMPTVSGLPLQVIDVSHNKLKNAEGLHGICKLSHLDMSYNLLTELQDDIRIIKSTSPHLQELCIRGNPWVYRGDVRLFVVSEMKGLLSLDNRHVSKWESEGYSKMRDNPMTTLSILGGISTSVITTCKEFPYLTVNSIAAYLLGLKFTFKTDDLALSWAKITSVCLNGCQLCKFDNLERLSCLKFISLDDNYLKSIDDLTLCSNLEEISAENNYIRSVENIRHMKKLRRLLLGNNLITSLDGIQPGSFPSLQVFVLRSNLVEHLEGLDNCKNLRELYIGNNRVSQLKTVLQLKHLGELTIIDMYGNPIAQNLSSYRLRIIHYLRNVKCLDGSEVSTNEVNQSRELLGGHLSREFLMDRLETDEFEKISRLDLPSLNLKIVDSLSPETFTKLQSVNLEKNHLTSFGGLLFLPQLRVLCLNENSIEGLFPRHVCTLAARPEGNDARYFSLYKSAQPIFPYLQVVHLAKNQIGSLRPFQFHRMPALRSLFLQHNEIVSVNGLEGLHQLKELVLDGNRIKEIEEVSFLYNWSLQEIHIENNRLRELHQLSRLEGLKRLYIGGNRLADLNDLEKFAVSQKNLIDISVVDNPIAVKQMHRLILIHGLPRLQTIDGVAVTEEEREYSAEFYAEQDLQNVITANLCTSSNQSANVPGKPCTFGSELALPGICAAKISGNVPKMFTTSHVSLTSIAVTKPSYAVVNIGAQPVFADNERLTKQTVQQSRTGSQQAVLSDTANQNPGVSHSSGEAAAGTCTDEQHSAAANLPGMSIQPVISTQDLGKTMFNDKNKTQNGQSIWKSSSTCHAMK